MAPSPIAKLYQHIQSPSAPNQHQILSHIAPSSPRIFPLSVFFRNFPISYLTNRVLSYIIHLAVQPTAQTYGGIAQLVEHPVHTRVVICSSQIAATRPVGQKVKTPPFHGGNMGSIPVRVTKKKPSSRMVSFLLSVYRTDLIGFDHKHFAIVRWPRCKASQLLA